MIFFHPDGVRIIAHVDNSSAEELLTIPVLDDKHKI